MFTSYAQNFEDVMLWRALGGVKDGFYIDIGAEDPIANSVSYAFYERGWRGVHVEPTPEYAARLREERPDETVLETAISSVTGDLVLYEIPDTGMSTADREIAERHRAKGFTVRDITVTSLALHELLDRFGDRPIHWLKIDVEGMEQAVIEGWRPSGVRPWIVVVESTEPNSQRQNHQGWEPLLIELGYQFVYFDGLNRFYVHADKVELKTHFATGPNFFDQFAVDKRTPYGSVLYGELNERDDTIRSLNTRNSQLLTAINKRNLDLQRFDQIEAQLTSMLASRSWRITAPLRAGADALRYLRSWAIGWVTLMPGSMPRRTISALIGKLDQRVQKPALRRILRDIALRIPGVGGRLRNVVRRQRDVRFGEDMRQLLDSRRTGGRRTQASRPVVAAGTCGTDRRLLIYVDHTISCPVNTGVQRVTRGISRVLAAGDENVAFVKWDEELGSCVPITPEEREWLSRWHGPEFGEGPDEDRLPAEDLTAVNSGADQSWLIVPEVTHHQGGGKPTALQLITWARQSGLKTGFVFYDAIPLRREEFVSLAPAHNDYMRHLRLADVIWPISRASGEDLKAFWAASERADKDTTPEVVPMHLPVDFSTAERSDTKESEHVVLCVGTVEPRKNQLGLIEAFKRYRSEHPDSDWTLKLVGNMHSHVAEAVLGHEDAHVHYLGTLSDEELDDLYRRCAFTVFPSTDEGYGLPILESVWYGKPCLCANFGAMGEIAEGGGCATTDVRDPDALHQTLTRLIEDGEWRRRLAAEACGRELPTWEDYAAQLLATTKTETALRKGLGTIYYYIDATRSYNGNTGIQRVVRQLARSLQELGLRLVPVVWGGADEALKPARPKDLIHLARWSGPTADAWAGWVEPGRQDGNAWFIMPELPLNLTPEEQQHLVDFTRARGIQSCAIFFDAIPWKMRDVYPPAFANAQFAYMKVLAGYDRVLPISEYSAHDLISLLGVELDRPQSLENRIVPRPLAGEFRSQQRVTDAGDEADPETVSILAVGTVEPRKNHELLLRAFKAARQKSGKHLRLTIAGGSASFDMELPSRVRASVDGDPDIEWREGLDDETLVGLYAAADFTVYASVEEGFGLPILESLWNGKPCICAGFGAMAEVGVGGGCLMVDVCDETALADAIVRLADDPTYRHSLKREALSRRFKTWRDYAIDVGSELLAATAPATGSRELMPAETAAALSAPMGLAPRPKLSVCISTYNREPWLRVNLDNWARLYPEPVPGVELLVCDNASTDNTSAVVRPFQSRPDFRYVRNTYNVGMLGNLRETSDAANGEFVWILGDDDLIMPGTIERVLSAIEKNPEAVMVYLNYAYTREDDTTKIKDLDAFFASATPIVPPEPDMVAPVREISTRNENFFTAIYTLALRRDHAINAYSQNTSGRPFSTMLTAIPTTYYVLNHMMDKTGVWLGTPQLVVNMNVSWLKYAPLWILERIPEVYEIAEIRGASQGEVDRWRRHSLDGILHYFPEIYREDPLGNAEYFVPARLVRRFKHLPEFRSAAGALARTYRIAHEGGHSGADEPVEYVFASLSNLAPTDTGR